MRTIVDVRNPGLGGRDVLEVEDTIAANDDIKIKRRDGGAVSLWRGDIPKLIAILEAFLVVRSVPDA